MILSLSYDLETLGIFDRVARARVEDLEMIEQEEKKEMSVDPQLPERGRLHFGERYPGNLGRSRGRLRRG